MESRTTVVTKQVTVHGGEVARDWSTGILGCFSDVKGCLFGVCCPLCFMGRISTRLGEHCCVPCCVPGGMITLRTKLRLMLGIKGSVCHDCLMFSCCGPCMACQMYREMDTYKM